MIKAVFFDLDGTLLPFDRKTFEHDYFKLIYQYFYNTGNADAITKSVMEGVAVMTNNTSDQTNEKVFIDYITAKLPQVDIAQLLQQFTEFYQTSFQSLKDICTAQPLANELVNMVKGKGYPVILATNPLFPQIATYSRIQWAGISPDTFDFITTYENSYSGKPNDYYYQWLFKKFNVKPEEVILVGNDCIEDGKAVELGVNVYIITDTVEHGEYLDKMTYSGSFKEVMDKLSKEL